MSESDMPIAKTAEWVSIDRVAMLLENAGVGDAERLLDEIIRSGQVACRGKNPGDLVFIDAPDDPHERRDALREFKSTRGMHDFQIDYTDLRNLLVNQGQIPGVRSLPVSGENRVSLSAVISPMGHSSVSRELPSAPRHGFWEAERMPLAEPEPDPEPDAPARGRRGASAE